MRVEQFFPTGVPRATAFFNISSKILFSKCPQTSKQIAIGFATGCSKLYSPAVGCRKPKKWETLGYSFPGRMDKFLFLCWNKLQTCMPRLWQTCSSKEKNPNWSVTMTLSMITGTLDSRPVTTRAFGGGPPKLCCA